MELIFIPHLKFKIQDSWRLVIAFLLVVFLQNTFSQTEFSEKRPEYDATIFKSKQEYLWILKAYEFAKKGAEPKAIELAEKAIQFNPTGPAVLWKAYFHEQAAQRMVRDWHKAKEKQSRTLDRSAVQQHYLSCLQSYQKSVEIFPKDEMLHYRLGHSYLEYFNDPSKAEEHFLEAFTLAPQQPKNRIALARTYLELKRYGEARREAETTLKEQNAKVQAQAQWILGRIEMEQKNFSRAMEEFALALSLDPGIFSSHYFLAIAKQQMGQTKSAEDSYRTFLKLFSPATLNDLKLVEEAETILEQLGEKKGKRKKI